MICGTAESVTNVISEHIQTSQTSWSTKGIQKKSCGPFMFEIDFVAKIVRMVMNVFTEKKKIKVAAQYI